jgi:predicted nucleic acid-binding protein
VPIVSNAIPLIAFAAIERLPLLPALFESVIIPPTVAFEARRIVRDAPAWVLVRELKPPMPPVVLRPRLGDGEREAIALAVELGVEQILLDDLPARKIARELGLSVIGVLGVLLAAKRQGLLQLVRPEREKLLKTSFFLTPQLVEALLRDAGEADS